MISLRSYIVVMLTDDDKRFVAEGGSDSGWSLYQHDRLYLHMLFQTLSNKSTSHILGRLAELVGDYF